MASANSGGNSKTGNPIDIRNGNKYETVLDFVTGGKDPLAFRRYYNSRETKYGMMGPKWRNSYDRRLIIGSSGVDIRVHRATGRAFHFEKTGSVWAPASGEEDAQMTLAASGSNWELTLDDQTVETYDSGGKLTSVVKKNGYTQTLSYDANDHLSTVTDSYDRQITFEIGTAGYVTKVTDPDGQEYKYSYGFVNPSEITYPDGNIVTYHYENPTNPSALTGITDGRGVRYATWTYDSEGRATSSEHAGGAEKTTLTYNVDGTVTVKNALGKDAKYHIVSNAKGERTSKIEGIASTNCVAADSEFTYDSNGYVTSIIDGEGNKTTVVNNSRGLPTSITEADETPDAPEERVTTYTWHATLRKPTKIEVAGRSKTEFTYDATTGEVLTRKITDLTSHTVPYSTDGDTRQWTYTYTYNVTDTEKLEKLEIDGPLAGTGDKTTYDYDSDGYLTKITDAVSNVTDIVTMDGMGRPTRITDASSIKTDLEYDGRGRLTKRIADVDGAAVETRFTYDGAGQLTKVALADGTEFLFGYDDAQRLIEISNRTGERIIYTLNDLGNVTKEEIKTGSGSLKKTLTRTFDELGRMMKEIGAGLQETQVAYNKNDLPKTITDANSAVTSATYDGLSRIIKITDALTNDAEATFDDTDNITQIKNKIAKNTDFVLNGFGEVIRRTSPESGVTDYEYDDAGNLTKITDARSVVTNFTYDNAYRRLTKTFPASTGENVTYTYDSITGGNHGKGRLTKIDDDSGSTEIVYDARGNVTKETRTIGAKVYTTEYAYDDADNPSRMIYPSGRIVTYLRDANGRVFSITTRKSATDPEQVLASNITYLPHGPIDKIAYGNGQVTTLAYDQDYRLTDLDTTDGTTAAQDLAYVDDNRGDFTLITDNLNATPNGITGAAPSVGTTDYVLNNANRLKEVKKASVSVATYKYNDFSQRVIKDVVAGDVTHFHYDLNGLLIAESDDLGATDREYVSLNGLPIAIIDAGGTTSTPTETTLDNGATGTSATGTWDTSTAGTGYEGSDYRTKSGGTGTESYTWTPTVPATDIYRVYAKWMDDPVRGSTAKYTVHHASGSSEVTIDQKKEGGTWKLLGLYPLAPSSNHRVVLSDEVEPFSTAKTEIIVDNTDPSVIKVGTWTTSTTIFGYQGTEYLYNPAGTGADTITWPAPIPEAGRYKIYTKWTSSTSRVTDAPYTIHHTGGTTTIDVNQQQNGSQWNLLGSFELDPEEDHKIVLTDDATGTNVIADAVRFVRDDGAATAEETIVDNTDTAVTYVGTWPNSAVVAGYQGANYAYNDSGGTGLDTATWSASGLPAAGSYHVYAKWTSSTIRATNAPYTIHHAGGTTTVTVNQQEYGGLWYPLGTYTLDPTLAHKVVLTDNANGTWVIADAIKFVRDSTATADIVMDNGAATQTGTWLPRTYAYGGVFWGAGYLRSDGNGLNHNLTWTPTIATAGRYRIYARWVEHDDYAPDAPFTVHHTGGTTTVRVDQRINGGQWNALGDFDLAPAAGHKIVLSDDAQAFISGDAVRLVRIGNARRVVADAIKIVPNSAEDALYVHADHLGTPQKMSDASAAIVWDASYTPFGEENSITGTETNNNRFPGQYIDAETGLHYNWHRYYDPNTGRYITADPIGLAGGLNVYAYVGGNPVYFTDRNGLLVDAIADGGFICYDLYRILADNVFGSNDNLGENLAALGADLGGLFIPLVTGGGAAVRAGKHAVGGAGDGGTYIYRAGSGSPMNMTPRPKDGSGLSAANSVENSLPGPNQVIDTSKFKNLCAICDNVETGHVSITPKDISQMQDWMNSRGGPTPHPLTQELMNAIVGTVKK